MTMLRQDVRRSVKAFREAMRGELADEALNGIEARDKAAQVMLEEVSRLLGESASGAEELERLIAVSQRRVGYFARARFAQVGGRQ